MEVGIADRPEHYPFSSAVDFAGVNRLVNIEVC